MPAVVTAASRPSGWTATGRSMLSPAAPSGRAVKRSLPLRVGETAVRVATGDAGSCGGTVVMEGGVSMRSHGVCATALTVGFSTASPKAADFGRDDTFCDDKV